MRCLVQPSPARSLPILSLLAALAASCSQAETQPAGDPAAAQASASATEPRALAPTGSPDGEGAEYRYTQLSSCTLTQSVPEEAGFTEHECPGEGGYRLRLTESDLRQNVHVLAPAGGEHDLALPALADGTFSSVGGTIEWRGETAGGAFTPRALILRQSAMEDPNPGVPEASYLVVARLIPSPCVVARIAPGPNQNARARAAADRDGGCL